MYRLPEKRFSLMSPYELISHAGTLKVLENKYNSTCKSKLKELKSEIIEGFGHNYLELANDDILREGESPATFVSASARGLAKLSAAMANGGTIGDFEVLSEEGWTFLHENPTVEADPDLHFRTSFTKCGISQFGFDTISQKPKNADHDDLSDIFETACHTGR